jgi:restriction endonuclease S subunit
MAERAQFSVLARLVHGREIACAARAAGFASGGSALESFRSGKVWVRLQAAVLRHVGTQERNLIAARAWARAVKLAMAAIKSQRAARAGRKGRGAQKVVSEPPVVSVESRVNVEKGTIEKMTCKHAEREEGFEKAPRRSSARKQMGNQSSDHRIVRLGDICDGFINGVDIAAEQVGRGVKFVNTKDVVSNGFVECAGLERVDLSQCEIERRMVRPNDLLFVRSSIQRAGVGYISMMPEHAEPVMFCRFIIKCTPRESEAVPKFLLYALRSPRVRRRIIELSTNSARTNISQDNLKLVEVLLPPLEEQRRMVAEIEGYQKLLDDARQILASYNPGFEIDPGWPTWHLGEVSIIAGGGTPSKANFDLWRGDIPWVSPRDMKTGVILDTKDHISPEAVKSSGMRLVPMGTVLCVVRSGVLRHTLPIAITGRKVCFNPYIKAITPNPNVLAAKFLFYLLKTRSAEILRDGIKRRAGKLTFHKGFFKNYEIPLPPLNDQRRIIANLDAEAARMEAVRSMLTRLEAGVQRVLDRVWGNTAPG